MTCTIEACNNGGVTRRDHGQGRSQEFVFFIIRGANHINLYKNLIKFQIYNAKLGTIGGPGPCPPPSYAPDHGPSDLMNPTCPKKPDPTNVWTGLGPKFLTRYKSRAWVKFFDLKPKKSNLAQPDLKIIHKNQVLPDLAKTRPNPIMYQDESG